jgi:hypothetical protein
MCERRWLGEIAAACTPLFTRVPPEIGESPRLADEINRLRSDNPTHRKSCEMRHFELGGVF